MNSGGCACILISWLIPRRKVVESTNALPPLPPEFMAKRAKTEGRNDEEEFCPEKREAKRRRGKAVEVFVARPGQTESAKRGWVVDRSRTGLRLILAEEVEAGGTLKLLPASSFDCMEWVAVTVVRCAPKEQVWEVGCRLEEALPWAVLLRFG